ncbi:rodlin RdlA [Streptomyces durmitorensis]|uniref:RdlA protein n=1 Tax=Streptomyces durmitorensis TaxID=319947 RepID=A0ABY4PMA2_9ACTN|nr:rodlin [Streptomyces durmitorensis]UQT54856.1 RdlA protein [Streptomyces durmitorensis]
MSTRNLPLALSLAAVALAGGAGSAAAVGDDTGTTSLSGNGAEQAFGNSTTEGDLSAQGRLVDSSLNKLCAGVPVKANVGSLVGILVPVAVQDIPVLSAPQNQQCAENSTQAKQDEPLSHLLSDIPAVSGNGANND